MTHLECGVDLGVCVHMNCPSFHHPPYSTRGWGWSSQIPGPSASLQPSDAPSVSGLLNNGDLVLKDISHDDDGLYQCTVANHVGYSVCVVEMKVSGRCSGPEGPVDEKIGLEESGLCFGASDAHCIV